MLEIRYVALAAVLFGVNCSSSEETNGVASGTGGFGTGGVSATGGATTGGASTGAPTGGVSSGAAPSGGTSTGGLPTGGASTGGMSTGGASTGGTSTGGTSTGGSPTGGVPSSGGTPSGGGPSAGASSAGAPNGGVSSGGDGGAAGSAGSTATGGGGNTEPPRLCILPLGDSITQSNNTHVSHRYWLWEDLIAAGYDFDFVGSLNTNFSGSPTYPNPDFDRDHEGHWGWRVDEILAQMESWLNGYTPDVVLMHLGTNDAFQNNSTDSTIDELTQLIGMLRADNERVVILLAKLIPSTNNQAGLDALNGRFDALAASLTTDTSPIVVVDQSQGFDVNADTFDQIHPNEGGEKKMAAKWLEALAANWPSEGGACEQ